MDVLEYSDAPLVSSDIVGNPVSCVFDSKLTHGQRQTVMDFGWYDNEWGHSCRMVEIAVYIEQPL